VEVTLSDLLRRTIGDLESAAAATAILGDPGAGADSGPRPGGCPLSISGVTVELPAYLSVAAGPPRVMASLPGSAAAFERTAALGRFRVSLICTADPRK
jgi:hypothetical protein